MAVGKSNDPNKKVVGSSDNANGNAVPGNTPAASGVSTPGTILQYESTGTSPNNSNTPYNPTHSGGKGEFGVDYNEYVNTSAPNTGNYKGLGSIAHDGTAASLAAVEGAERDKVGSTNPDNYVAYTPEELKQLAVAMGLDPSRLENNAARRFMSNDSNYIYSNRDVVEGGAGADEFWMNDGSLDMIRIAQQNWANATTQEERDYWHTVAEKIRASMGYSGGTDGTLYLTHGYLGVEKNGNDGESEYGHGMRPASGSGSASGSDPNSDLKGLLDAWQDAAINQSNGKIDYAVAKAVADLERALADAQPMFKEQAETVAREERQALDNSALYAEMRGDKGGIGQEQYNSIQNTAAQNHLTVQQAQTKLATDTQRQIADLRAQGEFEKADAALQITQQYLQQLIGLEQWAAEYNLSVDQFNESVRQWEAEYNMAMQQLQISQNQWQAEYDFKQQQYSDSLNQYQQSQLSGMGEALLSAGIMPSAEQLSAMGMTQAQAQQYIAAAQIEAQFKGSGNGGGTGLSTMSPGEIYQALYDAGFTDKQESSIKVYLNNMGVKNYADYAKAYINDQYKDLYEKDHTVDDGWGPGYDTDMRFHTNGQPVASEWEMIKSKVRSLLEANNYTGVTAYLDELDKLGRWSEKQWNEIRAILDNYDYFN